MRMTISAPLIIPIRTRSLGMWLYFVVGEVGAAADAAGVLRGSGAVLGVGAVLCCDA